MVEPVPTHSTQLMITLSASMSCVVDDFIVISKLNGIYNWVKLKSASSLNRYILEPVLRYRTSWMKVYVEKCSCRFVFIK